MLDRGPPKGSFGSATWCRALAGSSGDQGPLGSQGAGLQGLRALRGLGILGFRLLAEINVVGSGISVWLQAPTS